MAATFLLLAAGWGQGQQSQAAPSRTPPATPLPLDSVAASIDSTLRQSRELGFVRPQHGELLRRIYQDRSKRPLWLGQDGFLPRFRILLETLCRARQDGLSTAEYPGQDITAEITSLTEAPPTPRQLARIDLLLTAGFLAYGDDLLTGRFVPEELEKAWHIDASQLDVDSALTRTLDATNFGKALQELRPPHPEYAELLEGLKEYRRVAAAGGWPRITVSRLLRQGDADSAVATLRQRLRLTRDLLGRGAGDAIQYDSTLAAAVRQFQSRHGLAVDGVVGPATRKALNVPVERRILQLEASLERLRWLPHNFGERYVVVNVPEFRLHAYEGGREALSMRVVVGSEFNDATPIMADSVSYLQFNPYWNVPNSIARAEILPQAIENPAYLESNGYELVNGWREDAPVIPPESIGWDTVNLQDFPYRVRQQPGPNNSLGRVKFMFPNELAIYLHDTPSQSYFQRRKRAYSHGCVRVAEPAELGSYLLSRQSGWDVDRIRALMDGDERRRVHLDEEVPVYILYLTAVSREGGIYFREDIYGRDEPLLRALRDAPAIESSESPCRSIERMPFAGR